MTAVVKVKSTYTGLAAANNVSKASYVYCVNTAGTEQVITVANTVSPKNGGGDAGSIMLEAGASIILRKQPTDTIISVAGVKATNVSRG